MKIQQLKLCLIRRGLKIPVMDVTSNERIIPSTHESRGNTDLQLDLSVNLISTHIIKLKYYFFRLLSDFGFKFRAQNKYSSLLPLLQQSVYLCVQANIFSLYLYYERIYVSKLCKDSTDQHTFGYKRSGVIFISFCGAEHETGICFVPVRQTFAGLPGPDFTLKIMMKRLRNRHFYILGNKI